MSVYVKPVIYFGKPAVIVCDGNCQKAWGMNSRPTVQLSEDEDDFAYLSDSELGRAPDDPGTYEGADGKPDSPEGMNKWCARECERSNVYAEPALLIVRNFANRVYNIPLRRLEATKGETP